MRLKLMQIRELLEGLASDASVSITSAANLARELFTHTGAGTLVRQGEAIDHYHEVPADRRGELESLLESSFGQHLRSDWLEGRRVTALLMARSGRAAALLVEGAGGVPYLDKFVVTPEAQGEGLGAALWQAVRQHCPKLYWRARAANPIAVWYFQQSHTTHRKGQWIVYTIGVGDHRKLARLVEDAASRDSGWKTGSETDT